MGRKYLCTRQYCSNITTKHQKAPMVQIDHIMGKFVTVMSLLGAQIAIKSVGSDCAIRRNAGVTMMLWQILIGNALTCHMIMVVTAVPELGNGKPKFYSTADIMSFCRKWCLPTNHIWSFSSRYFVASIFAAYAHCEEGTATTLCKALDEVADISVPGSKDHIKVQGEILEGLVARIVSHESSNHMIQVLKGFPLPAEEGGSFKGKRYQHIACCCLAWVLNSDMWQGQALY